MIGETGRKRKANVKIHGGSGGIKIQNTKREIKKKLKSGKRGLETADQF